MIEDKIIKARVELLIYHPFFSSIILTLPLIDGTKLGIETMGTDGRALYYCPKFIEELSHKELVFVLAHEAMHIVYQHMHPVRRKENHIVHNMATDYNLNYTLAHRTGKTVGEHPEKILLDEKYSDELTSDEIYDKLLEDDPKLDNMHCHIDFDPDTGEATITTASGKVIKTDKIKPLGPGDAAKEKQRLKNIATRAASSCDSQYIKGIIKDLLEPKVDWRQYLANQVASQIKDDYTFSRPSRKCQGTSYILPSLNNGEHVEVHLAIDTSGSINQEMLREFLSEVNGIVDCYRSYKITIMCFDTEIHSLKSYDNNRPLDVTEYEVAGGGGTDFEVVFDKLKELGEVPGQLVFFTDGYPCGSWGDEGYCSTLFLVSGNAKSPFGVTINI